MPDSNSSQTSSVASDAFVKEVHQAMCEQLAIKGQTQVKTARDVYYRHGIIPTDDEVHDLIVRVRRLYASDYADTGI